MVQTTIQDTYQIQLQTTFATDVPAPVVTITAPSAIPTLVPGQSATFNVTLTNHGLIAAQDVTLNLPTDAEYTFTALSTNIGVLPAESSVVVPITVTEQGGESASGQNWVAPFEAQGAANAPTYDKTKTDYNNLTELNREFTYPLGLATTVKTAQGLIEGVVGGFALAGDSNAAAALQHFLGNSGIPFDYGQGTDLSNQLEDLTDARRRPIHQPGHQNKLQKPSSKTTHLNQCAEPLAPLECVGSSHRRPRASDLALTLGGGLLQYVLVTAQGNVNNGMAQGTLTYQFVVEYGFGFNEAGRSFLQGGTFIRRRALPPTGRRRPTVYDQSHGGYTDYAVRHRHGQWLSTRLRPPDQRHL